jgi:N-methylhydantoinase A
LGSELVQEILEYERTVTAVINAFLTPVVEEYAEKLADELRARGFKKDVYIMSSAGGILPAKELVNIPIASLMAGPAAGVLCGAYLGRLLGYNNIITTDMGGTSFDYGIVYGGEIRRGHERTIEFGTTISFPCLDIETMGAGGGTIARVEAGAIIVGPESAGSYPGPACYGLGGEDPTLTDAEVILGKINPDMFIGGEVKINPDLAKKAIETKICAPTGMGLVEAAAAIERLLVANMTDKVRVASVGRGYDVRDFVIMAYGGGGPMLVPSLAKEIGIPITIIPERASVHSALGLILADIRHEFVNPVLRNLKDIKREELDAATAQMREKCNNYLEQLGIAPETRNIEVNLDVRYVAQTAYITIPYQGRERVTEEFLKKYQSEYGYTVDPEIVPIEIVNVRGFASGIIKEKPTLEKKLAKAPEEVKPEGTRDVWWSELDKVVKTNIYRRDKLTYGNKIVGPAIVEQRDTTVAIPPAMVGEVDKFLNIIIRG